MKNIYSLATKESPDLSEVGGKALNLIETTQAGLRVPGGLVLGVAFFDDWTGLIKNTGEWQSLLDAPTRERCDAVKELAKGLALTEGMQEELDAAMLGLKGDVFAVRSSSPEEDLAGTSFAGMYETFLGTRREAVPIAIASAYSSMLDFRVMEYKAQNGIDLEGTCISVIVQHQIASETSGVGFSLNPLNNCYDEAVINAGFGLGEAIVSGVVTPDTYIVDKVAKTILSKEVNKKELAFYLKATGGISESKPENPGAQVLTDEQILELTELMAQVETHYDAPMDIEWATFEGALYLLQARPITTHFPLFPELLTAPGEPKKLYSDLIGTTQGFSTSFSVLGLDLWAIMMDRLGGQGTMPAGEGGILVNVHGRQYTNVGNLVKAFGRTAGYKTINNMNPSLMDEWDELLPQYTPAKKTPLIKSSQRALAKVSLGYLWPTIKMMMGDTVKLAEELQALVEENIAALKALENDRPFDELIDAGFGTMAALWDKMAAHVPGLLAKSRIEKMFKGMGLDDELAALGTEIPSNPTGRMGRAMFALAGEEEFKATPDAQSFSERITKRDYSNSFLERYDEYMYRYGDRGMSEIDIATPRLRDQPEEFYRCLAAINTEDSRMTRSSERKEAAYARLCAAADELGKRKKFEKATATYQNLIGARETPKYLIVILTGNLHKLALQEGEKFVAQGRLDQAKQVFDLHVQEVVAAQKDETILLRPLVQKNTAFTKSTASVRNWPSIFDSRGKIIRAQRKGEEGDLLGHGISNGVVTGRAKVLASPYEKPIEPGEILVTHATEPSWTPIFNNASGVVLEVGGALQHGAIIAREYGIPGVSGIEDATSVIKDGDLLQVDGTNGIVKVLGSDRLEEEPSLAVA